jgi:hypothetical protein
MTLPTRQLIDTPYYTIDIMLSEKNWMITGLNSVLLQLTIHPLQNKLYLVSSIGQLLVITDKKGNVEQAMPISQHSSFPQQPKE